MSWRADGTLRHLQTELLSVLRTITGSMRLRKRQIVRRAEKERGRYAKPPKRGRAAPLKTKGADDGDLIRLWRDDNFTWRWFKVEEAKAGKVVYCPIIERSCKVIETKDGLRYRELRGSAIKRKAVDDGTA